MNASEPSLPDRQIDYWDRAARQPEKIFSHPLPLAWLTEHLATAAPLLDCGCGYGRTVGQLGEAGFSAVEGIDPSGEMIRRARAEVHGAAFHHWIGAAMPFPAGRFDAVLLLAVLTCIPHDADQRRLLDEIRRVLRPGGLLLVSDYPLQSDARNRQHYERFAGKYGRYGVFEVPDGAVLRHHDEQWTTDLLARWELLCEARTEVVTMNGHPAEIFQYLLRRREGDRR